MEPSEHELDLQALNDSLQAEIRRVKELEMAKKELLEALRKARERESIRGNYLIASEMTELISKYK